MVEYRTLSETLDAVNDDRCINRADVAPHVLRAQVWHMIASFPGCLGDNHSIARSRKDAMSGVEYWLDDSENSREYSARYVRGQLRRFGICYLRDGRVITLNRHTVADLI